MSEPTPSTGVVAANNLGQIGTISLGLVQALCYAMWNDAPRLVTVGLIGCIGLWVGANIGLRNARAYNRALRQCIMRNSSLNDTFTRAGIDVTADEKTLKQD